MDSNTQTLLIVFVALTGVAVLLQACVLLGILIALRKAAKSVKDVSEDLKVTVLPLVHSTREVLDRITPQIVNISQGISELTETVQKESVAVRFSVAEITGRVTQQVRRLDSMLTTGLDAVERTGSVLEAAVALPVRQANGIFAAAKAVVATYRSVVPPPRKAAPVPPEPVADPVHRTPFL